MTSERWERLKDVFQAALEQPLERRPAFLDEACLGDAALRAEIEALLLSHLEAGSFIEQPPMPELAAALDEAQAPPRRGELERMAIGGFRLLRRIGSGGMGVVYEAEQERPHRLVALKVIRGGSPSGDQRLRLFEREVEALARLKHPGIAAIYQAGQTDDGEPFFAMELAHGTTLGEALRGEGPAGPALRELRSRLRLFVKICEAVNYAHQRGVVHRDLKPANILVGAAPDSAGQSALPEVKILDFGLARITDPERASSLVTQAGTIQGTFAYMSPEQARGHPDEIDLRSDVYSLGVILYELVAGAPPYELGELPVSEAIRIVCDEAPRALRGRQALTGSASRAHVDRDLAIVVMKALEKDPARRYQSALALAEELERYLADEPILARAPSTTYQLARLVRRHRAAFGGALLVFLLVAAAAVFMTIERNRARAAETQARREAARATAIKDFLKGILASGDPRRRGRDALVLDVVQSASRDLDSGFPGEPEVEAALRDTLSEAFYYLGEYAAARQQAEVAARLHERVFSREHLATQKSLDNLVAALIGQGGFQEAEKLAREVVERKRRLLGGAHRETLGSLANLSAVLLGQGRFPEAETVSREISETGQRSLPPGDEVTMTALNNLGLALRRQDKFEEAERVLGELVEVSVKARGENHPETLAYMTNLVVARMGRGKLAEAEPMARRVFEVKTRVLGASHAETVVSQSSLGLLLCRQKREEGAEVLRALLAVVEAPGFQGRHPAALYQGRLGDCMRQLERYPESERLMLVSYEGLSAKLGAEDSRARDRANGLAGLYEDWKRPAPAAAWKARGEPKPAPKGDTQAAPAKP